MTTTPPLSILKAFVNNRSGSIFILTGAAGTGKTYLIGQLANELKVDERQVVLLAPTGRAARVLSEKTGLPASTIHSKIYSLRSHVQDSETEEMLGLKFGLKRNQDADNVIYIVDESSMISDTGTKQEHLQFGTGSLLRDFIDYTGITEDYDPDLQRKIIFAGDPAQLPPVGSPYSPALNPEYLDKAYGVECESLNLTTIYRHAEGGMILRNALALRSVIESRDFHPEPLQTGADVETVNMAYIKIWQEFVRRKIHDRTILITSTNAGAVFFNKAMRRVLFNTYTEEILVGDRLMVVANNLFHQRFNGDLGTVIGISASSESTEIRFRWLEYPVTLVFRTVSIQFDSDTESMAPVECKIIENLLFSTKSQLDSIHLRALRTEFEQRTKLRYPAKKTKKKSSEDLALQREEYENALATDPYYNALQVKFGYAVTCHKAQGGEWDSVFVDFRRNGGQSDEEYVRWVYTALTRAKRKIYAIYPPGIQQGRVSEDMATYPAWGGDEPA